MWGRDNNKGSFFGRRLNLDSRNWTKANTETNDNNDRRKWAPKPHPLAREPKMKEMEDHPLRARHRADEELHKRINDITGPNLQSADKHVAEMIGLQVDAKHGAAKARLAKAHAAMVEDFDNWLRGNGKPEEYRRANMDSLAEQAKLLHSNNRAGKLATLTPISKHDTVRDYLSRKVTRKIDYEKEVQKRKLRQGRTGPPGREATLRELWELYKYGVVGLQPEGPEDAENTDIGGDSVPGHSLRKDGVSEQPLAPPKPKPYHSEQQNNWIDGADDLSEAPAFVADPDEDPDDDGQGITVPEFDDVHAAEPEPAPVQEPPSPAPLKPPAMAAPQPDSVAKTPAGGAADVPLDVEIEATEQALDESLKELEETGPSIPLDKLDDLIKQNKLLYEELEALRAKAAAASPKRHEGPAPQAAASIRVTKLPEATPPPAPQASVDMSVETPSGDNMSLSPPAKTKPIEIPNPLGFVATPGLSPIEEFHEAAAEAGRAAEAYTRKPTRANAQELTYRDEARRYWSRIYREAADTAGTPTLRPNPKPKVPRDV